jgi:hypothetical protein
MKRSNCSNDHQTIAKLRGSWSSPRYKALLLNRADGELTMPRNSSFSRMVNRLDRSTVMLLNDPKNTERSHCWSKDAGAACRLFRAMLSSHSVSRD